MAESQAIRCMQLPLYELQLLVPNSAVAEIIGYTPSEDEIDSTGWYLGRISWRGVMVPTVLVEQMCHRQSLPPGPRSRIAIIYNPDGNADMPYLGIILQDIPRAYLAEQERLMEGVDTLDCQYLSSRADVLIEQLVVPDLDAIIKAVGELN